MNCAKFNKIREEVKRVMTVDDYSKIENIVQKSRENQFVKTRHHLQKKFTKLSEEKYSAPTSSKNMDNINLVKDAVLNLTNRDVPRHHRELLNLGPKFVPTPNSIPYMDIIKNTEIAARNLERSKKHEEAEHLRSEISNCLKGTLKQKVKSNLTKDQRVALKELTRNDVVTKVYPFDKGAGFALIDEIEAIKKLEEQIGESTILEKDPTNSIAEKFRKVLSRLKKENKIDKRMFYDAYPSDPVPPRMYGMLKAHKPTKGYPMRLVVSTIGTPSHGTSKMLVEILQPTLNKNPIRIINSSKFVQEAKEWNISSNEFQVSYDVVALYPSVPISKSIDVITDMISADFDEISKRTKLSKKDIRELIELCLSKCYFLWRNRIYLIKDAGPIGLSLMVVMAESYLQHLEEKAISVALSRNVSLISFKRYVDDSHARFENSSDADTFLKILNSQDSNIQYTMETEDSNKTLAFLDVKIHNDDSGKYDFNIYRKDAITNVQIKGSSCIDPKITIGVFKGFLARAWRICSQQHREDEFEFLIKIFVENGHNENTLRKTAREYIPPEFRNDSESKDNDNDSKPIVKVPWIPGITPKLKKLYKQKGFKVICTSSPNLKSILCRNKDRLLPNSSLGVYELDCTCGKPYVGETKKKILTRALQHQKDSLAQIRCR